MCKLSVRLQGLASARGVDNTNIGRIVLKFGQHKVLNFPDYQTILWLYSLCSQTFRSVPRILVETAGNTKV